LFWILKEFGRRYGRDIVQIKDGPRPFRSRPATPWRRPPPLGLHERLLLLLLLLLFVRRQWHVVHADAVAGTTKTKLINKLRMTTTLNSSQKQASNY